MLQFLVEESSCCATLFGVAQLGHAFGSTGGGVMDSTLAGMIEWTKHVIVTIWAIRILKLVPIGAIRIPKSSKNRKRGRRRRAKQTTTWQVCFDRATNDKFQLQ